MSPETKGTSAHLLPRHKSQCGSELAEGCYRVSLPAPGQKEQDTAGPLCPARSQVGLTQSAPRRCS